MRVHIILPAGFPLGRRELKRGALDYLDQAEWTEHDSYEHFSRWRRESGRRLVLLTTKADRSVYEPNFEADDILMLGRESAGVPDAVAADAALKLRIPMRAGLRSINVAIAGAMVLGEALRQTGAFKDLQ